MLPPVQTLAVTSIFFPRAERKCKHPWRPKKPAYLNKILSVDKIEAVKYDTSALTHKTGSCSSIVQPEEYALLIEQVRLILE